MGNMFEGLDFWFEQIIAYCFLSRMEIHYSE